MSALAALMVTACGTASTLPLWRDPGFAPAAVHRVFVVATVPKPLLSVQFENALASALAGKGFQVATASAAVPPGSSREQVAAYITENHVDLVVDERLTFISQGPYYASPGYATAETSVYAGSAYGENPVWTAVTTAKNYTSVQEAAASLAASIVDGLLRAGILVR